MAPCGALGIATLDKNAPCGALGIVTLDKNGALVLDFRQEWALWCPWYCDFRQECGLVVPLVLRL